MYSLGLWGWKSSGTQGRISSGCPPSTSQNSGVSWPWLSSVISALPLRSFLLIFSAKSLRQGPGEVVGSPPPTTPPGPQKKQPYLALVVLLSVARLPRHTKRSRPWSRRNTKLEGARNQVRRRQWGVSQRPPHPEGLHGAGVCGWRGCQAGFGPTSLQKRHWHSQFPPQSCSHEVSAGPCCLPNAPPLWGPRTPSPFPCSPGVQRRPFQRHRLQLDVLLPVDTVQPRGEGAAVRRGRASPPPSPPKPPIPCATW